MPETQGTAGAYRFGVFEADRRTAELTKQGRRIRLRGRPFDILMLLLDRGGAIVTREELQQRLWSSDTFVDFDHGLNASVNRLREALGDSADSPRFIETIPKRGYRFIAPITIVPLEAPPVVEALAAGVPETTPTTRSAELVSSPPPTTTTTLHVSRPSRLVLAVAFGVLAIALVSFAVYRTKIPPATSKMTLAVLPFQNLSSDPDQDFFSDGFTEEMIAAIGKLDPDRLGVIARTTTMVYKHAQKTVGQIRNELGVDYVLEGSVRRSANRVRITAQLVQTGDMTHLWSESYDRDVSDTIAIQSEVAMKIAASLALALERPRSAQTASSSFAAYELTLRGRSFRDQATEESARKAIEYFQRAIALDPSYAPAHAGLADAYWLLGAPGWEVERPTLLLQKSKAAAERALAADMQSTEGHAVLSMIKLAYEWNPEAAEREIREAIRLNPNNAQAHQYYSTLLTTQGRFDEAIRQSQRAFELDPLSAPAATTLGIRYYYARRCDDAIPQFMKTLESSPGFGVAHWGLAQCYRLRGDAPRELDELQRAVELSGNSAYMRAHLAYGLATAGDRTGAEGIYRELESEGQGRYASPYHFALIAAGLGNDRAVVADLERAFDDRSGWLMFLPVQPEFERVRQTPEIQRLLARVKPLS